MTRTDQWKSYLLGHHEFREIATDDLFVDTAYQRELNEAAITRYVNGFDANMFEPLTVNERKNGSAKPTYALLDGQHRKTVAKKLGMKNVTCRVLRVDAEMEAQLFIRLNKDRIHLSQVSAFKAELAAKNPAAIEIRKCLADRDLVIGNERMASATQSINAVNTLQKVYARGGYVRLARLLDTIILSWPEDEPSRFVGQLLHGLDDFLGSLNAPDTNKIAEKLARTTPQQLLSKAAKRWHGHRMLGQTDQSLVNCVTEALEIAYRATGRKGIAE